VVLESKHVILEGEYVMLSGAKHLNFKNA